MNYFPKVILNFIFGILCYILNPIVVLFADDNGYLPKALRWFQTHDQSLDNDPEWVERTWPILAYHEGEPRYMHLLKRYLQRVRWIYRNTGYTFAYEVMGFIADPTKLKYKGDNPFDDKLHTSSLFIWETGANWWNVHWCYRLNLAYFDNDIRNGYLRVYLGWKMCGMVENPNQPPTRCMMAMHFNPFRNCIGAIKYIWAKKKSGN